LFCSVSVLLYGMKINHALRPDSRWDTWGQSRLRSTQRALRDDTLDQLDELFGREVWFNGRSALTTSIGSLTNRRCK
jgi:hypothetical protein